MYFFDRFLISYFATFKSLISKKYVTDKNKFTINLPIL